MIINSLLDTDLYKFTMMQVVLHRFPGAAVEYRFKCRIKGGVPVDLRPYAQEIREEIQHYCSLRFKPEELCYLQNLRFMKTDFIEFLKIFQLNCNFVKVDDSKEELEIIIHGPWLHTILFEVPLLAIISEIYFCRNYPSPDYKEGRNRLRDKIKYLKQQRLGPKFKFSDFGTRRRFSHDWHAEVIHTLKEELPNNLSGTSNVFFAKELGITPMGTMAHEFLQACQTLGPRIVYSQQFAFQCWADEYRGDLGIALSDIYTTDAFLNDFDLYFCKLFDGARQDSGDPIIWGERLIEHYKKMRIDPRTKTLVFSDNLTFPRAVELYKRFKDRTNPAFGIGTDLTNDLGYQRLQLVLKMTECNGHPVAKLSDSPEKTICQDAGYLAYLKQVFKVE